MPRFAANAIFALALKNKIVKYNARLCFLRNHSCRRRLLHILSSYKNYLVSVAKLRNFQYRCNWKSNLIHMLNILYNLVYSNVCLYICVFKKGEYGNRMFYTGRIGKVSLRVESGSTPESVKIICLLSKNGEMSVSDICDRMGCSQALISHHLTDMQAKGILLIRRRGVMLFIVWRVIMSRRPCGA